MNHPFFTIGHSTRTIAEFVDLLRVAKVQFIVDVRTVPRSRTNPQYNRDTLPDSLASFQIGYDHIAELGGLRNKAHDVSTALNGYWENQSFHNYADYALSQDFRAGLQRLISHGREQRCAIMCSESVWWRCHRRIIADYLLSSGESVFHLMGKEKIEPAKLTEGARATDEGGVVYPARSTRS